MGCSSWKWLLIGTAHTLGGAGLVLVVWRFDADAPAFYLGLVMMAVAAVAGLLAPIAWHRSRLESAYEIGFEEGRRVGRADPRPKVIHLRPDDCKEVIDARIPTTTVRQVAGDHPHPRWTPHKE